MPALAATSPPPTSLWPPPGQQLRQRHRAEAPGVDADVELARQGLEAAVAVAVELERAAVLAVPGAQRVVAQDQAVAVEVELGIVPDRWPSRAGRGSRAGRCCRRSGAWCRGALSRSAAARSGATRTAKSPRCQTVSPGATVAFQRSTRAASMAATEGKGRRNRPSAPPWPKWVSAVNQTAMAQPCRSCSRRRGSSSAKLQGRWRMSSWKRRISSQPSRQAPGEPGRQKM